MLIEISHAMDDKPNDIDQRRLLRVIQAATALSLGLMFAFLLSIKEVNPALRFQFSPGTILGFVLGAGLSWTAWQWIFLGPRRRRRRLLGLVLIAALLAAATLAAFAYALKDVPADRLRDLATGAGWAAVFLGALGLIFWRVARFLERDSAGAQTTAGAQCRELVARVRPKPPDNLQGDANDWKQ
ncbi:MAG: hypothetical protein KGS61_08600 [Verrucomicrobia bacterium]|nr:hypothetical protein [Verrucomicrobiota bacterium]